MTAQQPDHDERPRPTINITPNADGMLRYARKLRRTNAPGSNDYNVGTKMLAEYGIIEPEPSTAQE